MKIETVYNIETYDELLQCAQGKLDIPDNSVIDVKEDLIYEVRDLIMRNQCKDADILAPYLNEFFIDEQDKFIKDMVRYYIPEFNITVSNTYEPYEKLEDKDYVAMWLPRGLWEYWKKLEKKQEKQEEWLHQTPNIIQRR